jgi:hypothetical protein
MAHDNNLIGGETGSGKTNLALWLATWIASQCIVWLGKETRAGAMNMAKWALQNRRQFIFDDLDDWQRVFPLAVLPRTEDLFEQHTNTEGFIESVIRRRGAANADMNPMLETVTQHWSKIIYERDFELNTAFQLFRQGKVGGESESIDFWNDIPGGYARERTVGPT